MRYLSFCVTTYNRFGFTLNCVKDVLHDDRISEIIISDDCSTDGSYEALVEHFRDSPKVKVIRTESNQGCYRNKMVSATLATNEWVVLADSDNEFPTSYFDAVYALPDWHPKTAYCPSFAKPHFDYRGFEGEYITKENVASCIPRFKFDCLINTCNFVINRAEYLRLFDYSVLEPWAADTILQNYNWLRSGNSLYVVPGMEYTHNVHDKSHFAENQSKSIALAKSIEHNLSLLK